MPATPAETAPVAAFFVGDDVTDETVVEELLLEFTGVLTDRELRWILEDTRSDVARLSAELSRDNARPVCLRDTADSARHLAGLLDQWQRQLACADGTGQTDQR